MIKTFRQCVTILQACTTDSDDTHTVVAAQERSGLWKVNKKMQDLFLKCECTFWSKTVQLSVKVICTDMLQNGTIISNLIRMNLFEQILALIFRLRTISFRNEIQEKHKATKKLTKKLPLRTEINKLVVVSISTTDRPYYFYHQFRQ